MDQKFDPPIVGIGASAGGVQALQTFFEHMSTDTGAAFVVIIHLDPRSRSELASILASRTQMPVTQIEDQAELESNHVYVIPPNRRLKIADGSISALPFEQPRAARAPIDVFFRSLAEQHGTGFAVVLTAQGRIVRSASRPSRRPAASCSCRIRARRNMLRCLAMPSPRKSPTSSFPSANFPRGSANCWPAATTFLPAMCYPAMKISSGGSWRMCACGPDMISRSTSAPPFFGASDGGRR
ncbi:Chemotaxis protein methyltransferase CheR [Sinorhizobium sp. CCBAU 05631]|nr:Chemotaxis protein methyltransferase CheR [Sinorhizobium sp. CCBAU 05631]